MPERDNRRLGFNAEENGLEVDRQLHSALASYAGADSGLAERVLTRVATERVAKELDQPNFSLGSYLSQRAIWWAVALPIAACLLIAIAFLTSRHRSADRTDQARAVLPQSTGAGRRPGQIGSIDDSPSVGAQHKSIVRVPRHLPRAASTEDADHLPKLEVFPAPQPLTAEEKGMVAYVAHVPVKERKSLIEDKRKLDEPLTIAALEIQPLEPPEAGGN